MIRNHIRPEHLDEDFVSILSTITTERVAAKQSGEKVKADALKITINSLFGKLGHDTFWLEDVQAMLSVTISGQLYLLMLIEALAEVGIPTISANTDGMVCKIPREKEGIYYEVCRAWEEQTGFALEYTDYALYVRSHVNSYLTSKRDGTIKEKGRFARPIDLHKSYKYPIVPICLSAYFIKNIPIEETLAKHRDILDFCSAHKTRKYFQMELHAPIDRTVTVLQKTNRVYVSRKGHALFKRNTITNRLIGIYVGKQVQLLNDYDAATPFEAYDVDLSFYKHEIEKIIHAIDPPCKQMAFAFPD
jgi:DNA polymerase elongation subunit (family B)